MSTPFTNKDYLSNNLKNFEVTIERSSLLASEESHLQDDIELIYVESGSASININGIEYIMEKGSFVQLLPYHVHNLIKISDKEMIFYRCKFSIGMLLFLNTKEVVAEIGLYDIKNHIPYVNLDKDNQEYLISCLSHLLKENTPPVEYRVELANISLVAGILLIFERNSLIATKKYKETNKPLIWQILNHIYTNYNESLSLKDTADYFKVTTKEINDVLTKVTTYNFKENLHNARIINTCALIQFEELSLEQISRIVGYKSETAFYQQFKKYKHVSPDEYRNKSHDYNIHIKKDSAKDIFQYVNENYYHNINIKTATNHLSMSQKRINKICNDNFELSFIDLLNSFRILVSVGLLKSTELSIDDISRQVGFNSYRSFIRNFENTLSILPSKYRELNSINKKI